MKNFAIIGVGGFVAPRHLRAIKDTGNQVVAAVDPSDSVGILDSYFDDVSFFTEFERFDRHCEKLRETENKIDYVSVCSPNFLHDAHIRFGLRIGADVICEKPVVLNPWNIDQLKKIEAETNKRVNAILQLRLNPVLKELKASLYDKRHKVKITYITPRGLWYQYSWKGNIEKSGGLVTNIGIHLFDILLWLFGKMEKHYKVRSNAHEVVGNLILENADIDFKLAIKGEAKREMMIDGQVINLSDSFNDLHTESYTQILVGNGFSLDDILPATELVYKLRESV